MYSHGFQGDYMRNVMHHVKLLGEPIFEGVVNKNALPLRTALYSRERVARTGHRKNCDVLQLNR